MAIVALQTDWGLSDGCASALAGNVLKAGLGLSIYPVQHCFPSGDVLGAAGMLYSVLQFFPEGTVYLSIVERAEERARACFARTHDGKYIVTPDNGTLTAWVNAFGIAAIYEINKAAAPKGINPYAWCASRLAMGDAPGALGREYHTSEAVLAKMKPATVRDGFVECSLFSVLRNFGNLNLNVGIDEFARAGINNGEMADIEVKKSGKTIFAGLVLYEHSFGFVKQGEPIMFNGSSGYMGLGLNQESFAAKYMPETLTENCALEDYAVTIRRRK